MNTHDFTKFDRKAFFRAMEKERQRWLAAGMSEADIFRIHFGEGGDYDMWLSERKHFRGDRKYCPGSPISLEDLKPDGGLTCYAKDLISDVEVKIDLERAFSTLTELQRFCFVEVVYKSMTQQSVALEKSITQQNVNRHIKAAKKKLKKFFMGRV